MTDKSFGDHLNRNIAKNPLLLTAVTGLSIEDLTHNAVLLPAAPSQELTARHDLQIGPQIITLAHADRKNDNFPSGDANSNILHPNFLPPTNSISHNIKHDTNQNTLLLSKASKKSDDDFDVDEYFARLQGTRYVSAPLNSVLKEDQKTNLDATEENLEEINLNEPSERVQNVEVQQSLTADIAQNFSQLPTVLPQVASAVFSSFSNMLSMKSREQTPDVPSPKPSGYQEVQFSRPDEIGVPLMSVDEPAAPKEVAPPPRELPIGGTSNYRITTKKKAYAQIPGLSSTHTVPYKPPLPNFPMDHSANFGPQQTTNFNCGTKVIADTVKQPPQMHISVDNTVTDLNQPPYGFDVFTTQVQPNNTQQMNAETRNFNIFNPVPTEINPPQTVGENDDFVQEKTVNLFTTVEQNQEQNSARTALANASIIPPPPMFSNVPKKESQANARSVLPPSVARRIGSNHPIIKPQTLPPTSIPSNGIFVPAPISDNTPESTDLETSNQSFPLELVSQPIQNNQKSVPPTPVASQSAFVQFTNLSPTADQDVPRSDFQIPAPVYVTSEPFQQSVPAESLYESRTANTLPPVNMPQSETAPPPMFFNPSSLSSTVPQFPPIDARTTVQHQIYDKQYPPTEKPSIFQPLSDQSAEHFAVKPPPTFFNPNAVQQIPSVTNVGPATDIVSHNFDQTVSTDSSKIVPEPPKLTGNLNYRMQKKRPQYYSGPIEGVGSISNNVKPTIPTMEPSRFQGTLFTPETQQNVETQPIVDFNSAVINEPINDPGHTYAQFDINAPQTQNYVTTMQDYNTVFDMSRQTTDNNTPLKEEAKGFGIIGSLKSKLSSLDINKIQSTVTTFFDPAYNDIKKEPNNVKENTSSDRNVSFGNQSDSSLDVFVPNLEQSNKSYIPCDYQTPYGFGQGSQYYQNQSCNTGSQAQAHAAPNQLSDYYQNPLMPYNYVIPTQSLDNTNTADTYFSPSQDYIDQAQTQVNKTEVVSTTDILDIDIQKQGTASLFGKINYPSNVKVSTAAENLATPVREHEKVKTDNSFSKHNASLSSVHQKFEAENVKSTELKDSAAFFDNQQFFNLSQPIHTGDLNRRLENLQIAQDKEADILPESKILKECIKSDNRTDSFNISTPLDVQSKNNTVKYNTNYPSQENENAVYLQTPVDYFGSSQSNADCVGFGSSYFHIGLNHQESPKEENVKDDILRIDPLAVPLFGLPNVLDVTSDSFTDIEYQLRNTSLFEPDKELETQENFKTDSLSENGSCDNKTLAVENESSPDLNICETCREVNAPEEKETDDVTTQLIDNITSPIQLSNPVIALLAENAKPGEDSSFESKQCAEISHITEETIETIQVQSATELLDDENGVDNMHYGWTTSEQISFLPTEVLLDHDYRFEIDTNALGFYGNNSFFFEDIPNNASDEIKAEFKSSHEETPILLTRQMSIPTAPPAEEEEDTRSDETGGLDVQLIEQDAKRDFPIFEEFVIEPSETDDDKIEYKERERSSDDPVQDIDTFTNRVERFQMMEDTVDRDDDYVSHASVLFNMNTATSPAVTIASYFDTGNYAVEAHYRNSISSPISIPPGFEAEYRRRMSGLSLRRTNDIKNDYDENIPYIPETTTQTKPITTTTYSMVSNHTQDTHTVTSNLGNYTTMPEVPMFGIVNVPQCAGEMTKLTEPTLNIMNFSESACDVTKLPESMPVITTGSDNFSEILKLTEHPPEPVTSVPAPEITQYPNFSTVFGQKPESGDNVISLTLSKVENSKPTVQIAAKTEEKAELHKTEKISDPISFFSSNEETPENVEPSFNRLASYFATPAKTDHGKSFFELSQSQNHYRHATNNTISGGSFNRDSILDKRLIDPINNIYDIPADVYLANLELMNDLTSSKHIVINPNDQIVKTVNYFTVEYDNDVEIKNGISIGEPDLKKLDNESSKKDDKDEAILEDCERCDDTKIMTVVTKCKFCCNNDLRRVITLNKIALDTDYKVRKAMDSGSNNPESRADSNAEMDQRTEDRRKEVTVTFGHPLQEEGEGVAIMTESNTSTEYAPVKHHWFYRVDFEGKSIWRGFSAGDNKALEDAFLSSELNDATLVATDGGRFDVNVVGRLRTAVYWSDKPTNVRRCSWFYKGTTDARYVPYTEAVADKLEEEYRRGVTTGEWHRRLVLPSNELVVMHGPAVMVHFPHAPDAMGSPPSTMRPRVVRRGCDESEIEDTEPSSIDHLLLLCHGVGSACDMRFRSVEEVVDDFRASSLQLLQSHYRNSYDKGVVNRVEVLPISWHATLHSGETGVDRRLSAITLDSIPRLRNFTNDTVLDVLFYTSPVFCQTIIDTVCAELNRIHTLFAARNPDFKGRVSLGGHSLGSVILYDLLCHQNAENPTSAVPLKNYVEGAAGTGQAAVRYPSLGFRPAALYALGSPIAMFECIRGVASLGVDFSLPTCDNFFNIFHPYDPIAYRIEPLINSQLGTVKPFLIPHHKGRKRMHLELKDTMARVGADLKQKLIESLKSTWTNMWKSQPPPIDGQLEKVVEEEIEKEQLCEEMKEEVPQNNDLDAGVLAGRLNGGRRVDYVLQEAPLEMINEYLFAMSSHVCYWESEDTMLLILREIYDALNVQPDSTVPQQSMSVQRARPPMTNETYMVSTSEYPSTSRDGT